MAYGEDIGRKAAWAIERLTDAVEIAYVADALLMDYADANRAVAALSREVHRLWPAEPVAEKPTAAGDF